MRLEEAARLIPLEEEMSKAIQKATHLSHTEKLTCAFCHGSGKDPFGQLYPGSTCQVCHGRREIFILSPYTKCTCCHGSGVAFSSQNTCTICGGRGVVSLGDEHLKEIPCHTCGGTGMHVETSLPCIPCQGLGSL